MAAPSPGGAPEGDFWGITSYFNPAGYVTRRANYRRFRGGLRIPLITVELSFDGTFQLGPGDAEILIQLTGGDVMWQKERLLNLALDALPPECDTVAWLDCDIVFMRDDWVEACRRQLQRFTLVQPFSQAYLMPAGWDGGIAPPGTRVDSVPAFLIEGSMPVATCMASHGNLIGCALGMAWAAPRDLLERHRLYDVGIVGGGDGALVRGAYGYFDTITPIHHLSAKRFEHYLAWAEPFHRSVRQSVGFVDGNLAHLWHGAHDDRQYDERHVHLAAFDYDPVADIALTANGVWRWNSDKPGMHAFVRDFFASRREDA